jgi:DNA-binding MarR family transcriptional regulator
MAPPSALADLYRRPGFLLKRCHQTAVAIFVEECREFSMTPSQYGCLVALAEYPGIDQLTLGRLVGLDRSTVGLVVKILSERELIERVVDPRDKRRLSLSVSAAGARLLKAIAPVAARAQERALAALPRESWGVFLQVLQQFLEGHGAAIDVDEVLAGAEPQPAEARAGNDIDAQRRPAPGGRSRAV